MTGPGRGLEASITRQFFHRGRPSLSVELPSRGSKTLSRYQVQAFLLSKFPVTPQSGLEKHADGMKPRSVSPSFRHFSTVFRCQ